ncbi:ABC transporter substrate-binding protein [Aneurinibacillus aneurinilyticus]|nr:ABC transporter substrate-binding protein [Aneurinibacillus aneurinilyticus]MCI1695456.1 ABC transporter substrate-binding protein [Aneurinibacillus aneurinilyticus]MED0673219.1 ABC transporter substrate-binding protein [Aneurinibacillus aneurinilyticus]
MGHRKYGRKTMAILSAILLTTSLGLVACGSGDKVKETTGKPEQAQEQKGGTLLFARGGDSTTLDPQNSTEGETTRVTDNIFDTLVQYKKDSTEVEPALATQWESSPDGKIWTFTLRENVKFHDGTEFDANSVKFNFDRMLDKSNEYHVGGNFDYVISQFTAFKGEPGAVIKEVKVLDKNKIQFILNVPQAPFLANIAMPFFAIESPEAIKKHKDKIGQHPVGTGPYKFVEGGWKPNDTITLEKNKEYWKGEPILDKIIFKVIPDNTARLTALKSGEVDLIDGMNPSDAAIVESDKNLTLYERPSMNVGYLSFNTEKKPFDNPKVRQALAMAVDKRGLVDAFFAKRGQPATNALPPSIWGYNKELEAKDYKYDLEKAKQLLAEAGYPNGFETDLWAMPVSRPYMPQPQKIAESIQADFAKIGVKTKLVSMEWGTYLKKTKNGEHTMALLGWTGDNGDPDNFLYVLLDKDNAKPPAAQNISLYKNEKVHELLIKAQTTPDQKVREDLYKQAQEIILNDAPMVPFVHSTPVLASSSKVKGYVPHATGSEKLNDVSIEK